VIEGVTGVEVGGMGVTLGIGVSLGTGVLVGNEVLVAATVFVGTGVFVGVNDGVKVNEGSGVAVGRGVLLGIRVLVGGGGGEGVQVVVGVSVGVQVMIVLGTAFLRSWQPLLKSIMIPKSLLTTPGRNPPKAQSSSKSMESVYELPLLKGRVPPIQLVGESKSFTKSLFPPRWKYIPFHLNESTDRFGYPFAAP